MRVSNLAHGICNVEVQYHSWKGSQNAPYSASLLLQSGQSRLLFNKWFDYEMRKINLLFQMKIHHYMSTVIDTLKHKNNDNIVSSPAMIKTDIFKNPCFQLLSSVLIFSKKTIQFIKIKM